MSHAHTPETSVALFLESSARARASGNHIASFAIGGTAFSGVGAATLLLGSAGILSGSLASAIGFATATTGMVLLSLMLLHYGPVARHLLRFGDRLTATETSVGFLAGAAGIVWAATNITAVLGFHPLVAGGWAFAVKALSIGSLVAIVLALWTILTIEVLKRTRVGSES